MSLMMSNDKGISAFPDGDKLFEWIATVHGPADSVYDGLKYKLRLEFPAAYPYTAPTVKFVTPCFHPNVDQHGNICLDILKEKWSALYEVRTILLSIQSLLGKYFIFCTLCDFTRFFRCCYLKAGRIWEWRGCQSTCSLQRFI